MTKYFCDRCGKESEKLTKIRIPDKKQPHINSFSTKSICVCSDCENEFDNLINKLTDIRFILFDDFMKEES